VMTNYDMSSFPGTPIGPKFLTNKRYVDEHNAAIRGAHILKAGDTMTGDLQMSGKRITGLPEGASVSNSDGASIGQVSKMVSSAMIRLNRVPSGALNVTNKQYVDSQISLAKRYADNKDLAAKQHSVDLDAIIMTYIRNLKIKNYNGHIPPLSTSNNNTGFIPSASSTLEHLSTYFPFNPMNTSSAVVAMGWIANTTGAGSWLQIECPTAVRIWKVHLCFNRNMTSWKISGAVEDGGVFTDLLTSNARYTEAPKPQAFLVDSVSAYKIYRFTALAFATNTGGSDKFCSVRHFQIFTYFKDGD